MKGLADQLFEHIGMLTELLGRAEDDIALLAYTTTERDERWRVHWIHPAPARAWPLRTHESEHAEWLTMAVAPRAIACWIGDR